MKLGNSNDVSHIIVFFLLSVLLIVIFPERVFEAEYTVSYKTEKFVAYDSLRVDVTWYTSTVWQTDSTPFITADGSRVRDGIIAVSQNLLNHFEYGDSLYIRDLGWFEIHDCMNRRWDNTVDIWCDDIEYAIQNGRERKWIYWNFREELMYQKL